MKDKLFWLIAVLITISFAATAQEVDTQTPSEVKTRKWFAGAGTGFTMYGANTPDYKFIRGNIGWHDHGYNNDIASFAFSWHAGLNLEMQSANSKFGYSLGVRYTTYIGYLGASKYDNDDDDDFFYVRLKESGTQTDYLRVKSVNQINSYIGVPVEFRYLPFRPMLFRPYMKLGADFNFKINDSSNVKFKDGAMDKYEGDVAKLFDEADDFYSTMYFGLGVKVGRVGKVNFNIDARVPAFVITGNNAGIVEPIAGAGFNFSVQVPL